MGVLWLVFKKSYIEAMVSFFPHSTFEQRNVLGTVHGTQGQCSIVHSPEAAWLGVDTHTLAYIECYRLYAWRCLALWDSISA